MSCPVVDNLWPLSVPSCEVCKRSMDDVPIEEGQGQLVNGEWICEECCQKAKKELENDS